MISVLITFGIGLILIIILIKLGKILWTLHKEHQIFSSRHALSTRGFIRKLKRYTHVTQVNSGVYNQFPLATLLVCISGTQVIPICYLSRLGVLSLTKVWLSQNPAAFKLGQTEKGFFPSPEVELESLNERLSQIVFPMIPDQNGILYEGISLKSPVIVKGRGVKVYGGNLRFPVLSEQNFISQVRRNQEENHSEIEKEIAGFI